MVDIHYHTDPTPLFRRPKCTANIQLLCTSTYTLVIIQLTCRVLNYDCGEHLTCRSMLLLSRPTATKRKVSKVSEGCTQMCSIWLKWAKNEFLTIKSKLNWLSKRFPENCSKQFNFVRNKLRKCQPNKLSEGFVVHKSHEVLYKICCL